MSATKEKEIKITFRQKNPTQCPICRADFYREELFTGRGRLIAGDLTDELRRNYQENKKYGKIYPLNYPVTVCPQCFFAAFHDDFDLPVKKVKTGLENNIDNRINTIKKLYPQLDFNDNRTLEHGLASYILAASCYSFFDKKNAPSFKVGLSAFRTAWLAQDLLDDTDDNQYAYIREIFYKKAAIFYSQALEYSQTGKELLDNIKHYGPDADNNFGYDGMLYLASLLNFRIGSAEKDPQKQAEEFVKSKRIISKMFGTGKTSKEKPAALLDLSRDLFDQINHRIKQLEEQLDTKFS